MYAEAAGEAVGVSVLVRIVGDTEVGHKKTAFEELGRICNDKSAWRHLFSQQRCLVA
jgi:hypothetical protein